MMGIQWDSMGFNPILWDLNMDLMEFNGISWGLPKINIKTIHEDLLGIPDLHRPPSFLSRRGGPIPRSSGAASASSVDVRGTQGSTGPRCFFLGLPQQRSCIPKSNGLENQICPVQMAFFSVVHPSSGGFSEPHVFFLTRFHWTPSTSICDFAGR